MKRKIFFILFIFTTFSIYSQSNDYLSNASSNLLTNITCVSNNNTTTQIDIFFEESIDPKTVTCDSILINNKSLNSTTKFIYSRDGKQIRFIIEYKDSFTLQLINVKTNSQKIITTKKITLNGDSEWKKY